MDQNGKKESACRYAKLCGGCTMQGIPYEEQLKKKQNYINELLKAYGKPLPIIGMEDPRYYRGKVQHVFSRDRKGNVITGTYEAGTHRVVSVEDCRIEDAVCQKIIYTIRDLCGSFRIRIYDEDTGFGLLRHVLVRRGFHSGEVMVVLVLASPILPSKKNFVKVLLERHPEIRTVVLNVNPDRTSMVLGKRCINLYGPGYIRDTLCGLTFRISPESFYQVNPPQTELLYRTALEFAALRGTETVVDAYCGIGTIGLAAAASAGKVIGIELNRDAVADAVLNAKENRIKNARFYQGDAGQYLEQMAAEGLKANVLFMDPPRSGSTEQFMAAAVKMAPRRIVYISCGPESLKRDLEYLTKRGYEVRKIRPVDMFPYTGHVETVCLLINQNAQAKHHVNVGIDVEEYHKLKSDKKDEGKE